MNLCRGERTAYGNFGSYSDGVQPSIVPGLDPNEDSPQLPHQLTNALQMYGYPVPPMTPNITGNVMPKPTTAVLPTMTGTARAMAATSQESAVKPLDLVRELPSIVNTEPVYMEPPCHTFSQWVAENPLLAGGLLFGVALLLWRKN